jgi:hypothetical protein
MRVRNLAGTPASPVNFGSADSAPALPPTERSLENGMPSYPRRVSETDGGPCRATGRRGYAERAPIGARQAVPLRPRRTLRRSDGAFRALAIPWATARATRRRQVSWLAGRSLMHGLPRPRMSQRPAQWLPAHPVGRRLMHRARRLQLQGQPRSWEQAPSPRSRLSPFRDTGAIFARTISRPGGQNLMRRFPERQAASLRTPALPGSAAAGIYVPFAAA